MPDKSTEKATNVKCPMCGSERDLVALHGPDLALAAFHLPQDIAGSDWDGRVCTDCASASGYALAKETSAEDPQATSPALEGELVHEPTDPPNPAPKLVSDNPNVERQAAPVPTKPFRVVRAANVPALHNVSPSERLPDFSKIETSTEQSEMFLPDQVAMPWLLSLFHRTLSSSGGGHGAPPQLHLALGALLHLGMSDRDGIVRTMRFTFEEINGWLYGGGKPLAIAREREADALTAALDRTNDIGIIRRPGTRLQILTANYSRSHDVVEFVVRIPGSAARGFATDWSLLCGFRTKSYPYYKAYLAACWALDKCAHQGHPQTATLPAPARDHKGQLIRGKGGALVRQAGERIENPNLRFVPSFTADELAQMMGYDYGRSKPLRSSRQRALKAFRKLDEMGIIHFDEPEDPQVRGYRILGRTKEPRTTT